MAEPQLSIRSARARTLARRLAKKERRTISQVVERALELYARAVPQPPAKETAQAFWDRIARENHIEGEPDIDLDALIREGRTPHEAIEL